MRGGLEEDDDETLILGGVEGRIGDDSLMVLEVRVGVGVDAEVDNLLLTLEAASTLIDFNSALLGLLRLSTGLHEGSDRETDLRLILFVMLLLDEGEFEADFEGWKAAVKIDETVGCDFLFVQLLEVISI